MNNVNIFMFLLNIEITTIFHNKKLFMTLNQYH
jgi:hypothetical protein